MRVLIGFLSALSGLVFAFFYGKKTEEKENKLEIEKQNLEVKIQEKEIHEQTQKDSLDDLIADNNKRHGVGG